MSHVGTKLKLFGTALVREQFFWEFPAKRDGQAGESVLEWNLEFALGGIACFWNAS